MAARNAAASPAERAYAAACASYLRHGARTPELLAEAIALDPAAPLPLLVRGLLAVSLATPAALAKAREALAAATKLGPLGAHAVALREALAALCDGELTAALDALARAATAEPACLVTAKLEHALCFMAGRGRVMLSAAEAARARAGTSPPGRGTLLGFEAFAREELDELDRAEPLAEQAVASAPDDPWAFHALLHVCEERGACRRGLALARTTRPRFVGGNNFLAHLAWHEALFALAEGEPHAALALYDTEVCPALGADFRDGLNCVGLLVRLERAGVHVATRWESVGGWARERACHPSLALADLHALVALLRLGDRGAAEQLADRLAVGPAPGEHGQLQRELGAPVARALLGVAHMHAEASDLLAAPSLDALGGSRAQRASLRLAVDTLRLPSALTPRARSAR